MKKKKISFFGLFVLIGILLLLLGYLAMGFYYSRGFSYGTWINGIYCTGKSVAEVNAQMLEGAEVSDLRIIGSDGQIAVLEAEKLGLGIDYSSQLKRYLRKQNPFLWIDRLTGQREVILQPYITYDKELLHKAVNSSFLVRRENGREHKVQIYRGKDGYQLYNGMLQVLNAEKVTELAETALSEGKYEINLAESDCYEDLPLTEEMRKTVALYEKIEAFQQCGVVYDMGDKLVPIGADITADWIALNENGDFLSDGQGELIFDEEKMALFIERLAAEYDTCGKVRTFHATRGEVLQIEGGTYGNRLDQKAETEYLRTAFLKHVTETRIPSYLQEAKVRGKEDIGDTYIEIDMSEQKMYYYEDGRQVLETDVVTGNMRRKNGTPSGVNYVYNKQKNRILRGEGYASFVKFWMPVKGNVGIHDASWRKKFGGEIYLTNGSHGCINTPADKMAELFDLVEIGTPVVMFY